jgi:hypothetical protein
MCIGARLGLGVDPGPLKKGRSADHAKKTNVIKLF